MDAGGYGHLSEKSPHAACGALPAVHRSVSILWRPLKAGSLESLVLPASFFILACVDGRLDGRSVVSHREESPDSMGRALGNSQAEQSDTSTTENQTADGQGDGIPI